MLSPDWGGRPRDDPGGGGVFYLWGAKYDYLNCVALNICTSIHFRNKYLEHVILATILV